MRRAVKSYKTLREPRGQLCLANRHLSLPSSLALDISAFWLIIRGTIISSVTDSYLKLGYHYWWPRKAGMFVKVCEGRGEYRLGDICFTHCPGSAGPPGASERQTTLKKSGMQVPSDHLGLTCSRQFAVCNWMGIY